MILIAFAAVFFFVLGMVFQDFMLNRHRHRWDKWRVIEEGKVANGKQQEVGNYLVQTRICLDCGKKQMRQEGVRV